MRGDAKREWEAKRVFRLREWEVAEVWRVRVQEGGRPMDCGCRERVGGDECERLSRWRSGGRPSQRRLPLSLYPASGLLVARVCVLFSVHVGKPLLSPSHRGVVAFRAHPSWLGDPSE